MTSQLFDSKRFGAYFRCHCATNAKRFSLYAAIILLTWTLICVIPPSLNLFAAYSYPLPYDPWWATESIWMAILLFLYSALAASQMYSALGKPSARVGVLTLPASNLEKFTTWAIVYFIGFLIVFAVSAIIADFVRVGIVKAFAACPETARPIPLTYLFGFQAKAPLDNNDLCGITITYGFILLTFSVFSLGSILFAKNSFIKTLCAVFALNIATSYIMWLSFKTFFVGESFEPRFDMTATASTPWIFLATLAAISAFFLWLGYRRFTEADNVDRW